MKDYSHYSLLAELIKYPSFGLMEQTLACKDFLEKEYNEAAEVLEKFVNYVQNSPLHVLEELYTKTFHIQAICYLDVGYVMFGEDYKRGEFLVNMKREQRETGNDCGTELPDNLMNVLRLLPRHSDGAFINELSTRIVMPSLRKMLAEFDGAKMTQRKEILKKKHKAILLEGHKYSDIYYYPLKAILRVMEKDFKEPKHAQEKQPDLHLNPFINNCGPCSISKSYKNSM